MTVYRILRSSGLNRPLQTPRVKRSYTRWQRKHPNSLWQCDLKVVPPARWLITNLDDHSRFVTGSERFNEGTTENVIWLLDRAIHEYSKPREILADHGPQFWAVRRGESSFDAYCHKKEIKHILGGIGQQRSEKSNAGSEHTTSNMPDSSSTGNSSSITTMSGHTWR
jgi:hypothetical protein